MINSNHRDEDAAGNIDHLQNINWDGLGGAVDTFDYSTSAGHVNAPIDPDNVDALANHQDHLFQQLIADQVPFLASFGGNSNIHFHTTAGGTGIWATASTINQNSPPDDVDALEIFGDDGPPQHDGLALTTQISFPRSLTPQDPPSPSISMTLHRTSPGHIFFIPIVLDDNRPWSEKARSCRQRHDNCGLLWSVYRAWRMDGAA